MKIYVICILVLSFTSNCFGQGKDSLFGKPGTARTETLTAQPTKVPPVQEDRAISFSYYEEKIKTWMPLLTTLIILLVSNGMILYKINRDTKEGIRKDIIVSKIKLDRDRLEKYYDPILTLLKANSEMFKKYGPQTFPTDSGALETEASEIWKKIVEDIIVPNNQKICEKIQDFSHLILQEDTTEPYLNFFTHAQSYKHFVTTPNSLHKSFKYPTNFIRHVEKHRTTLVKHLNETEKKLKI